MDISNIAGMYSDIYKTNNQSTSKLENQLNGDFSNATEEELLDACKQFEAYFVEQMYKAMMATVPESQDASAYTTTLKDYYTDEMVQQLAEDSTETNSLGLAQMLYEQMKRNYGL